MLVLTSLSDSSAQHVQPRKQTNHILLRRRIMQFSVQIPARYLLVSTTQMSVVRTGNDNFMFVALDEDSTTSAVVSRISSCHSCFFVSIRYRYWYQKSFLRSRGWNGDRSKNIEQTYRYSIVCRLAVDADASLPFYHGNVESSYST